jgi:hypothetical protein
MGDLKLQYHNAKITSTKLGIEDHGIMTFWLFLEWNGGGVGFGGYALDEWQGERTSSGKRVGIGMGMDCIMEIMRIVGVENWEDIKGKHIVVESEGWGGKATGIRNLIKEDLWFRPKEWFEARI